MTNSKPDELPPPPWLKGRETSRSRRPAASPLTREAIVAEALALVDEEGLEALTVRRLGDRLGVTMMALYWHVRDKAQLLDLVGDAVLTGIGLPDRTGDWRADLTALLRAARSGMRRHPNAAGLAFGRARYGPGGLAMFERLLAILADAGFDPEEAALAYMAVYTYLRGNWSSEASVKDGGAALREAGAYMASLPVDRFPLAIAAGPRLLQRNPDEFFEYGLAVVLDGIATRAQAARASAGQPG